MGDFGRLPASSKKTEVPDSINKRLTKCSLVASAPRIVSEKMVKHIAPLKHLGIEVGTTRKVLLFLVKVAALEAVRRFSKVKCPLLWKIVQGLQVLSYSPFKWLHRWAPIKILLNGMQTISRPLLLLSVTTAFSDNLGNSKQKLENNEDAQQHAESSALQPASIPGTSEEVTEHAVPEDWLVKLHKDLEKQGISLPDRVNDDELRRFYAVANGDLSCLMKSIKKTIRWRETYGVLSKRELESWSNLVFWHGYDVHLRPCLIIRFGLACTSLPPSKRPRFAQAVVSQMEHGVLFLVKEDDPRVTVLMDCEGLSPFRIPMQMMKSCSTLLQDHYPNRLGTLLVIRLPPVVRIIAQTFVQVLRPATRQKLQFLGESHQRVISDLLRSVPSFLGGKCSCDKCEDLRAGNARGRADEPGGGNTGADAPGSEPAADAYLDADAAADSSCEQVLRTAVVGVLLFWVLVAFLVGLRDADGFSF